MNIENLQLVNKNDTSGKVFRFLSKSTSISNETNLDSFLNHLKKLNVDVNPNDYYQIFKDLESSQVGSFLPYNGKQQGKFIWHYSFKDVSEQVLNPNKLVDIRPASEEKENKMEEVRRRGRPKGSINKNREILPLSVENKEIITTKRPGRPKMGRVGPPKREVVFMFNTNDGKFIPFNLSDAERLLKQVEDIKSQIA